MPPDRPTHVVAAIAATKLELGGIAKLTPQQRQRRGMAGGETGISYAYRGIDQIAGAVAPLFGRFGVVCVPNVLPDPIVEEIQVNGKPWRHVTARVEWHVYGPGGVDDCLPPFVTIGEGRDNSDKVWNKAQTAAYKNALLRLLDVGDPADDTDNQIHETDPHTDVSRAEIAERVAGKATYDRLRTLAGTDAANRVRELASEAGHKLTVGELGAYPSWRAQVDELLDRVLAEDESS
jgi:hypothetical protein